MVVGVLMLLTAIFLPSLSKTLQAGKLTRRLALFQQDAALVALYCADYGEVYPVASTKLGDAGLDWWQALEASGHIENRAEIDPQGMSSPGWVTVALSYCMLYDPRLMQPGVTEPIDSASTSPVRQSQVAHPSNKGVLYQWFPPDGPSDGLTGLEGLSWCCAPVAAASPVAMGDGSVATMSWHEFRLEHDGLIEGWVGYPVWSTWNGFLGRDR